MTDRIEVHGRVNGVATLHYGPKDFSADWGGVFTAFEIANLMTKLPRVAAGKRTPATIRRMGKIVEKSKLRQLLSLFHVTVLALPVDRVDIWGKQKRWYWTDKIHPTRVVEPTDSAIDREIVKALIRMDLNKWGVIGALTVALSSYDLQEINGRLSVSIFVTLG